MRLLLLILNCHSYSFKNHRYLGNLTKVYIQNQFPKIYHKLPTNLNFSDASVWADTVKNTKEFRWSKILHYMNIDTCNDTRDVMEYCKGERCVYTGILNSTNVLRMIPDDITHFKFLLHFLQDVNQPLHILGMHRGGNGINVVRNKGGHNKTINMHSLWDTEIPDFFIKNYQYYPKVKIVKITDYNSFLKDIIYNNLDIACSSVYVFKGNYILFEDYFKEMVVRSLFDNYFHLVVNTLNFIYS
jgi:hypothetical protein